VPHITYTLQQKAEAVALASVLGAEGASEQLGIDVRTVRSWAAKAGKGPELAVPTSAWQKLLDLAMARVGSALSTGNVRPKDAAVIAGIAQRNVREPEEPPEPPTAVESWGDDLEAALDAKYGDDADLAMMALLDAPDDVDWTADPLGYLATLGDLREWRDRHDAAVRAQWQAQLIVNQQAAEQARLDALDAETRSLVEAAERWLESTNDAA
jgi:hypothetical protein